MPHNLLEKYKDVRTLTLTSTLILVNVKRLFCFHIAEFFPDTGMIVCCNT